MYGNLGYTVYRQVLGYYSGENSEDAYGKSRQWVVMAFIIKSPNLCFPLHGTVDQIPYVTMSATNQCTIRHAESIEEG